MLLPLSFAAIGALAGALTARRRKGNGFDMAQWAAVWALLAGLAGFALLIVVLRA